MKLLPRIDPRVEGSEESSPILGIASLRCFADMHNVCAHYMSRSLSAVAPVVLAPYFYLFQQKTVDVADGIVVIDEAHHFTKLCMDHGSVDLTLCQLFDIVAQLNDLRTLVFNKRTMTKCAVVLIVACRVLLVQRHV